MKTANSTDPDQNAPVMSKSKSTHTDKDVSKRFQCTIKQKTFWLWHGISNNVVCATSKVSDQTAHTRSLIRVFASSLNIL